jgi:hypothetical protein
MKSGFPAHYKIGNPHNKENSKLVTRPLAIRAWFKNKVKKTLGRFSNFSLDSYKYSNNLSHFEITWFIPRDCTKIKDHNIKSWAKFTIKMSYSNGEQAISSTSSYVETYMDCKYYMYES